MAGSRGEINLLATFGVTYHTHVYPCIYIYTYVFSAVSMVLNTLHLGGDLYPGLGLGGEKAGCPGGKVGFSQSKT